MMTRDSFMMMAILMLGLLIFCGTTPWLAIEGKVIEVQDSRVKIQYDGKYAPRIGDRVSIGFRIDNDFVPVEGEWKIVEVNAQFAWARAEGGGAGTPAADYVAAIETRHPQNRADLNRPQQKKGEGVNLIPYIPALKATVTELRFYECGKDIPPYDQRRYNGRFPASDTRYISWELHLKHPEPGRRIDFRVTAKYYHPDGSLFTEHHIETYIGPNWNTSFHTSGWGWEEPGQWKAGEYTVEIFIKHQKVAHGSFTVY